MLRISWFFNEARKVVLLRGLYVVKFGRVVCVKKSIFHDGTETVPSWKIVIAVGAGLRGF